MSKLDVETLKVKSFDPMPSAHPDPRDLPDDGVMDPNQPPSQGCTAICSLYTLPC